MSAIPLAEWQAEMEKRGKLDCKFRCPVCGNEASLNDWKAAGADLQRAPVECIGRIMPRDQRRRAFPTEEEPGAPERPCDYAAFGLLNLCTASIRVLDGKIVPVFEFAP